MDRFTYKYYYQVNGQLMASYNSELYNGTERTTALEEQYIYGSNRIGTLKANKRVYFNGTHQPAMIDIQSNKIGEKRYELTNHLGNVLATISDRKIYNSTDGYYEPVITMKADYYAFEMLMPNRFEGVDESRHLFNGMEADAEVSGEGNSYTTQFRQYDPRLGRWKSLDPLMSMFPDMSPYIGFANNPIFFTDPYGLAPTNGDEGEPVKTGSGREQKDGSFDGVDQKEEVKIVAKRTIKQKLKGLGRKFGRKLMQLINEAPPHKPKLIKDFKPSLNPKIHHIVVGDNNAKEKYENNTNTEKHEGEKGLMDRYWEWERKNGADLNGYGTGDAEGGPGGKLGDDEPEIPWANWLDRNIYGTYDNKKSTRNGIYHSYVRKPVKLNATLIHHKVDSVTKITRKTILISNDKVFEYQRTDSMVLYFPNDSILIDVIHHHSK